MRIQIQPHTPHARFKQEYIYRVIQTCTPAPATATIVRYETSDPIDIFKDVTKIIKEFDINKFGKSKPKFDKNELSNLNSKFFQLMDFEDVVNKLKVLNLDITKEFWYLIRGKLDSNLTHLMTNKN